MLFDKAFTKENLDIYLKELGKQFRRLNGKSMPAEIILIGGAAILERYGFRQMTADVDAVIHASSSMKEAVNYVGDKFGLPNGWLNDDFMKTPSYSQKLDEFSVYYKTFYGVLQVRIVEAEYLIAMKLRSGRQYKNDLSDIIGILAEHQKSGEPITLDMIEKAVNNLYGGWSDFSEESRQFIENILNNQNYEKIFSEIKNQELKTKEILIEFEEKYPNTANQANVDEIINNLKGKRSAD